MILLNMIAPTNVGRELLLARFAKQRPSEQLKLIEFRYAWSIYSRELTRGKRPF